MVHNIISFVMVKGPLSDVMNELYTANDQMNDNFT